MILKVALQCVVFMLLSHVTSSNLMFSRGGSFRFLRFRSPLQLKNISRSLGSGLKHQFKHKYAKLKSKWMRMRDEKVAGTDDSITASIMIADNDMDPVTESR